MEHFKRHNIIWKLLWPLAWLIARLRMNYHTQTEPVKAPALIVSNHCTDLDPILLALTIKNHAYFVASDHIFRKPRTARFLMWAQAPIARTKGAAAGDTALRAIRTLRRGFSVALFAEGNRTFNGVTGDIVESTAKLARASGAALVTHRFQGGYFTSPRWAGADIRRGRMTGAIVGVYPPEELKRMTAPEIADLIRRDIAEDAYATQEWWHIPYRGKNRAQYLERALYLCPGCMSMGTLESEGDFLSCAECGFTVWYTPYGYLEGKFDGPRTIPQWDKWQAAELKKRVDAASVNTCLAADAHTELYGPDDNGGELLLRKGELAAYRDRFEIAGAAIPFGSITGINLNGPQALIFSAGGESFTVKSPDVCNMRKYLTIYRAAADPDNILAL